MTTGPQHLAAPPESRDDDPLVSTLMATPIVAITPDAPVATALDLMAATGVRHLPVFEGHRCRGLVVEADLIRYLVADAGALATQAAMAVGCLARPAPSIHGSARRSDAARRMEADRIDAVLVTDQHRLVGILTATDLIRSLAGQPPSSPHLPGVVP
jgi:CBS domain-containing protein